jgi:hypothetical protein
MADTGPSVCAIIVERIMMVLTKLATDLCKRSLSRIGAEQPVVQPVSVMIANLVIAQCIIGSKSTTSVPAHVGDFVRSLDIREPELKKWTQSAECAATGTSTFKLHLCTFIHNHTTCTSPAYRYFMIKFLYSCARLPTSEIGMDRILHGTAWIGQFASAIHANRKKRESIMMYLKENKSRITLDQVNAIRMECIIKLELIMSLLSNVQPRSERVDADEGIALLNAIYMRYSSLDSSHEKAQYSDIMPFIESLIPVSLDRGLSATSVPGAGSSWRFLSSSIAPRSLSASASAAP